MPHHSPAMMSTATSAPPGGASQPRAAAAHDGKQEREDEGEGGGPSASGGGDGRRRSARGRSSNAAPPTFGGLIDVDLDDDPTDANFALADGAGPGSSPPPSSSDSEASGDAASDLGSRRGRRRSRSASVGSSSSSRAGGRSRSVSPYSLGGYSDMDMVDADDLDDLLSAQYPGPLSKDLCERIDRFWGQTKEYLDELENWEVDVQREDGLMGIVQPILDEPRDDDVCRDILAALNGSKGYTVRQRHGGGKEIIAEYLINVFNAARGGFIFLVAAAARPAFFEIFKYLRPFFASGGKFLMCVPIGEIETGALHSLRAWAKVLEDDAETAGGSLRFFFHTEYKRDGPHQKEVFIAMPGNLIIKGNMTCNLTAASLGMKAVGISKKGRNNQHRRESVPQSDEVADFTLLDLDHHDTGLGFSYMEGLTEYWKHVASTGCIIWNMPALHEVFAIASESTPELRHARLLNAMLNKVKRELKNPEAAALARNKAGMDLVIGLGTTLKDMYIVPDSSGAKGDEDDEDEDEDERARRRRRRRRESSDEDMDEDESDDGQDDEDGGDHEWSVGISKQYRETRTALIQVNKQDKLDPIAEDEEFEAVIDELVDKFPVLKEHLEAEREDHRAKSARRRRKKKQAHKKRKAAAKKKKPSRRRDSSDDDDDSSDDNSSDTDGSDDDDQGGGSEQSKKRSSTRRGGGRDGQDDETGGEPDDSHDKDKDNQSASAKKRRKVTSAAKVASAPPPPGVKRQPGYPKQDVPRPEERVYAKNAEQLFPSNVVNKWIKELTKGHTGAWESVTQHGTGLLDPLIFKKLSKQTPKYKPLMTADKARCKPIKSIGRWVGHQKSGFVHAFNTMGVKLVHNKGFEPADKLAEIRKRAETSHWWNEDLFGATWTKDFALEERLFWLCALDSGAYMFEYR